MEANLRLTQKNDASSIASLFSLNERTVLAKVVPRSDPIVNKVTLVPMKNFISFRFSYYSYKQKAEKKNVSTVVELRTVHTYNVTNFNRNYR